MNQAGTSVLAFLVLATAAAGQSPCGPAGLSLSTTGGRLGDPFSLTLSGTPSVSGLLAFDPAPGPVATPIGPICLGVTPALQYRLFTLDAAGSFAMTVMAPPNPALSGFGVFTQAAAVDATQSSGYAVSNGAHAVLRPPRFFFIDTGSSGPPTMPGSWVGYDALTDSLGSAVPLPSHVKAAVAIPALGWIAVALGNGTLMAFDAMTGAVVLSQPLTTSPYATFLAVDGTTLVVVDSGVPPAPATLRTFTLPLGTPGISVPLPAISVSQILAPPGTGFVYVSLNVQLYSLSTLVVPVSLSTGALLPTISLDPNPSIVYRWILHNGIIYCLMVNAATPISLNAIDTSLNTAFFPTPVPLPLPPVIFGDPLFRFGPGTAGPSLFMNGPASTLLEISPQTLTVSGAPIPIPTVITDMQPSNGGTEWLLVSCPGCLSSGGCFPGPCSQSLLTMNPATHAMTTIGPIPTTAYGASRISVLPSGSLNKACILSPGGIVRFNTDPTTAVTGVPLLIANSNLFVIVD